MLCVPGLRSRVSYVFWEQAWREGLLGSLQDKHHIAEQVRGLGSRALFLHGPGGSGKTYYMTEVATLVLCHFFGEGGVFGNCYRSIFQPPCECLLAVICYLR